MKPLFVLILAFIVTLLCIHFISGGWNYILSGNIALAVMLVFTAIGHFVYSEGMALMMPNFIPAKKTMVYLTGVMEILFAAGLCITSARRLAADLLILFFLIVLPANINAAQKSVDYQKATFDGRGVGYLWLRIPMQVFFILWAAYFGMILQPEE